MTRLYLSQLTSPAVVFPHPGYQAEEMNSWGVVVPLPEPDTGLVGSGFGAASPHDVDGTAVTKDAARAGRRRDVSMFLGLKERAGWGVDVHRWAI